MTTPSSPPISLENVRAELGVAYPISLNQSNVLNLAGKSSAPISLLDLLNKPDALLNAAKFVVGTSGTPDLTEQAFGYSDGGGNDGPPFSEGTFGSLNNVNQTNQASLNNILVNAIYTYKNANTGEISTYLITRASYGAAAFNNYWLRAYASQTGGLISQFQLTYQYTKDETQTYQVSQDMFSNYGGQTIYLTFTAS